MAKYFDRREQQEKTVPDCSKAGLAWNSETQRCEQMSAINTLLHAANLITKANPQPSQNSGMGFLEFDDYAEDYWGWEGYYGYDGLYSDNFGWDGGDSYYFDEWGWYDPYSDEWGWWGDSQSNDPYSDLASTLDWWERLDTIQYTSEPEYADLQQGLDWWSELSQTPASNDPWLPDDFWDWLTGTIQDIPGVPTNPNLPGYCPAGTYHPINDPFSCVSFPTDPVARKQAQQQRKQQQSAAQKAAQAAKAQQKRQDQQCPPINGQWQWKNPQTGKCEPIPACPQGMVFDSTSRRCLTPQQVKEIYGDNNWLIWALIALGVLVVVKK